MAGYPVGAQDVDGEFRKSVSRSSFPEDQHFHNRFVVTLHGPNLPGLLSPFMEIMERPEYQICVRDIAQYLIEGSIVVSILIEHGAESSIAFIKDLVTRSRETKMDLDFRFSGALGSRELQITQSQTIFAINVACCKSPLPCTLLYEMFSYFGEIGSKILEIVHQRDDRIAFNGECSKIMMRVRCTHKVKISEMYPKLQKMCWLHRAEVTVREWEGMERPNGKSLVLFGLSDVLCPYDVMDQVLEEAGVDADQIRSINASEHGDKAAAKVKALAGKDASCMERASRNLEFTPGAHLVCRSLKDLGFRLAVLTHTGCKAIVKVVKHELGLDYAISRDLEVGEGNVFTGHFSGDHRDESFNKVDYVKIMAEKESIHPRNVIIVGDFLRGMSQDNVRYVLDTYGPMIYFHAPLMPSGSLTTMLYLLGFSGFDVEELRGYMRKHEAKLRPALQEFDPEPLSPRFGGNCREVQGHRERRKSKTKVAYYPKDCRRFLVRIRSDKNDIETFVALLQPLLPYCNNDHLIVRRIQLVSLASENVLLGLELVVSGPDPVAPLKDLLFESQRLGLVLHWDEREGDKEQWRLPRDQQYVVTVVERPRLLLTTLAATFKVMQDLEVDCIRLDRLSEEANFSALKITAVVPLSAEKALREGLLKISKNCDVDIAFQRDGIERWGRRLIVFDMDSTLIQQEIIDETAKLVGKEEEVKDITERAKRGELDFFECYESKIKLLKDRAANELFGSVNRGLTYTPGALQLCKTLKLMGYKMAVISGGFLPVAREVQKTLGLDYAFANTLEIRPEGTFTGMTVGPVVTPLRKRALLAMIAQVEGCDMRQTVAVGDGSNDIPMLTSAGLGVAFCAQPKVQDKAEVRVNNKDLNTVLYLIGLSENAQRRLEERHANSIEFEDHEDFLKENVGYDLIDDVAPF